MTQFWLVRHGQTAWNVEGRWQGQTPLAPPLNAVGQAEAEAVAEQLSPTHFAALYASDLLRARQTAEIIAERLGLSAQLDPRLREVNQGEWDGMLGSDIAARYPDEWAARERDPLHTRPPGGESAAEVAARVWAAAEDIASVHLASKVVIVSHGLSLATLICRAQGLPVGQAFNLIPGNAYPVIIEWA